MPFYCCAARFSYRRRWRDVATGGFGRATTLVRTSHNSFHFSRTAFSRYPPLRTAGSTDGNCSIWTRLWRRFTALCFSSTTELRTVHPALLCRRCLCLWFIAFPCSGTLLHGWQRLVPTPHPPPPPTPHTPTHTHPHTPHTPPHHTPTPTPTPPHTHGLQVHACLLPACSTLPFCSTLLHCLLLLHCLVPYLPSSLASSCPFSPIHTCLLLPACHTTSCLLPPPHCASNTTAFLVT